jgi:hypothetical protein
LYPIATAFNLRPRFFAVLSAESVTDLGMLYQWPLMENLG